MGMMFILGISIILSPSEAAIPPTPSFSAVYINGQPIIAERYNDKLYITTEGMINTTVEDKIMNMKLKPISCPALQAIKGVDADGNLVCGIL